MNRGKRRLALAAFLFLAWIGFLAYQVAINRDPVVLSRPQFLVANLYVVASLDGNETHPNGEIVVQEVAWAADEAAQKIQGMTIKVENLGQPTSGWQGPGIYILPLRILGPDLFVLAETPLSPGFYPKDEYRLRIYLATDQARCQLQEIIATTKN
jgi:hypothetical protein